MKTLCIIPARSGSKRLKNKNFLSFNGIPLVMTAIETAVGCADKVIVSVSDAIDQFNLRIFTDNFKNVEVRLRPEKLSADEAIPDDVVFYHVNEIDCETFAAKEEPYDTVIYLQCTSPLFSCFELKKMLKIFQESNCDALATVNHHLKFTGECIILKKDIFLKNKTFWQPKMVTYMTEKSADIDDLSDFRIAEAYKRGDVYGNA